MPDRRRFLMHSGAGLASLALPQLPITTSNYPNQPMINQIKIANTDTVDVIIIGAGAAGLSAALFLTRARRRTLIYDGGATRYSVAKLIHEFSGQEAVTPTEFQARARAEVVGYGGKFRTEKVNDIYPRSDGQFDVLSDSGKVTARAVVIATGLVDMLPPIPGLREAWGKDAHVCPCFSGYELRDQRLVVFGLPERLVQAGKFLTGWAHQVSVVTPQRLEAIQADKLRAAGVNVIQDEVVELRKKNDHLVAVKTKSGLELACEGVFVSADMRPASDLAASLCEVDSAGFAVTDANGKTNRPGLWVVGNASDPMGHIAHAVAAGVRCGPMVTDYLIEQSLAKRIEATK